MRLRAKRAGVKIIAITTTILGVGSVPGFAQVMENGAATVSSAGGVPEILVTARKRAERVQETPVSIAVLSPEMIERQDLRSLERIATATPQLTIGRSQAGAGAQLSIRGIGSNATSIGIESSVAVIVDGVYSGQGRVINEAMFDIGRIEVLKGPQALFFGKNATAGVIAISAAEPTQQTEAMVRALYEFNGQELGGEAMLSGGLTETLSARVAVRGSKSFGAYYRNRAPASSPSYFDVATGAVDTLTAQPTRDGPGGNELVGRLSFLWEATDELTARLIVTGGWNKSDNPGWNNVIYRCGMGNFTQLNPETPCGHKFEIYQNNPPAELGRSIPYAKSQNYNKYTFFNATASVDYENENISITSVSGYQSNTNDWLGAADYQTSPAAIWATEHSTWKAFSSELRTMTTFDSPVNILAGGYYQKTRRNFDQWLALGGVQDTSVSDALRYVAAEKDAHTKGETVAVFGQLIWQVMSDVEATAGVRYTHETKNSLFRQPYVNAALTGLFIEGRPVTARQKFTNWSPDFTLKWSPSQDFMAYGSYKTGYKSGGFSISSLLTATTSDEDFTFDPEKAKGFEFGVKTAVFDNQLQVNLGLYRYIYSNLQIDFFDTALFKYTTTNAGSSKVRGVELEANYAPHAVPGLTMRGTLNYNRSTYSDFTAPCYAGQTPAEGCHLPGPWQELRGVSTAMAPRWTGSFGAAYDRAIATGLRLSLSADTRYSGSYLPSAFGNPLSRQSRYLTLDASIGVGAEDGQWDLRVIGKNLTNRLYFTGSLDGPSSGSGTGTPAGIHADQIGFGALPRTVQMQLTWRY